MKNLQIDEHNNKDIIKANKLIAEFMKITNITNRRGDIVYNNTPISPHSHYELKFHSSWD